nr:LOW QUALITY PROTEIN: testis development-related protein [Caretta caretta]
MWEAGRSRPGCRGDRKARAPPALSARRRRRHSQTWQRPLGGSGPRLRWGKVTVPGLSEAAPPRPIMWKLNKSSKVLLDDSPEEEETRLRDPPPQPAASAAAAQNKDQFLHDEVTSSVSQLATKVQSASFRGWKEVTSMFNKDDEQQLLAECKSPKSKGTNLKLKEDVKSEKKSGFWDSLAIKQNIQSRKPDQIEGWEPPQITAGDPISDAGNTVSDYPSWSGWEDETKGSTKYTNLASSGNSSRWSIKSAGKLVSIRRQSKGNLTDNWEELE